MLFSFESDETIDLLYIELVRFKLLNTIKEVKGMTFDSKNKLLRITFNVGLRADIYGRCLENNFEKMHADVFSYIKKCFSNKKIWYITTAGRTIV